MEILKQYKKAVVGSLSVILSAVLASFLGDGIMQFSELVNVVVLGTGTISLAVAPNTPGATLVKSTLAAIAAAATVLLSVASGGVGSAEWAQIAVAVAAAYGVYRVPNKGDFLDRSNNVMVS